MCDYISKNRSLQFGTKFQEANRFILAQYVVNEKIYTYEETIN